MAQYPAASTTITVTPVRLVTKADTATGISLGSGTVSSDAGFADTYGSWAQIISSTAAESYITELAVHVDGGTLASADLPALIELGTGGAGSEVVKMEALCPFTVSANDVGYSIPLRVPFRVTASKRIAARIRTANNATKSITVYVIGLPISQVEGN
jgi:hypothetical protein